MSRISNSLFALLVVALATASPARAQDADDERDPGSAANARPEPTLHGELRLSLADAIAMSLENNLDVEIARYAPIIALQDHEIAWGAYDPNLNLEYGYSWIETPVVNLLQPGQLREQTLDWVSGVQGLVPQVGATYGFEYRGEKLETTSDIAGLSPEYSASVRLTLNLPLMRDLVWNQPWTQVKTSAILYEGEREDLRRELMDTVRDTEDAYWALVAADERLRVAEKSLETSRALLDQTRIQYDVGVVSRVEVTEAEAGVAEREVNQIREENLYRSAQDVLIDIVLGPHLTAVSRLEIEPTDDPKDWTPYDIDIGEAGRKAFDNRPELKSAHFAVDRQKLLLRFAENQRKPQLDFQGAYGFADLSGKSKDVRFGGQTIPAGDFNKSIRHAHNDFFTRDGALQWSARGLFSIPLGNNAARHRVVKTQIELRRANTQVRRLEQTIVLEVRDAARNLTSAQEGIGAAERRVDAAAEQLRAEKVRLEHGESTPFDVLERERDFVDSESQRIGAFQLYHSSVAGLNRAQGTTLKNRNVVFEEAARLR
jgi:outer membrane protein TolC